MGNSARNEARYVSVMGGRMQAAFRNGDVAEASDCAESLYGRGERASIRKAVAKMFADIGVVTAADIVAKIIRPVWDQALESGDDAALGNAVQTIAVWGNYGVLQGSSLPSVREIATGNYPPAAKREAFAILQSRRVDELYNAWLDAIGPLVDWLRDLVREAVVDDLSGPLLLSEEAGYIWVMASKMHAAVRDDDVYRVMEYAQTLALVAVCRSSSAPGRAAAARALKNVDVTGWVNALWARAVASKRVKQMQKAVDMIGAWCGVSVGERQEFMLTFLAGIAIMKGLPAKVKADARAALERYYEPDEEDEEGDGAA